MISALHSPQFSNFVGEYFKDMILILLVVIYFVVFAFTRPQNLKDERAAARGRRAAEAVEAAKVLAQ